MKQSRPGHIRNEENGTAKTTTAETREQKLARQLRENLAKRKAQAKARKGASKKM